MTTNDLCRRLSVTPRQVQWWCETGVLPYRMVGKTRFFDEEAQMAAAMVKELRRKGLPLERVRKIVVSKPKGDYLVVTPRSRLWCSKENVLACVADAACAVLVVSLEDLRRPNV